MPRTNQNNIVTRFAPSPTGTLHIGSARTALFNYIFAKKHNGKMILRIEDTDQKRSTEEYEEEILESLQWLGITWNEPVYRQSERTNAYRSYLKEMVESEQAYISREKNQEGKRSEVIRFKNPHKKVVFTDLVRGDIEFDTTELGDFVIAKDFDTPLYHLAVVIDDFEMGVTHIIRGEDGISNTPRQILVQEAIGAPRPQYAHIPLILAPDKSKLSKRHGAVSVSEYKNKGYLPEAMINFLALMGWSPQAADLEDEILSLDNLIKHFSLESVQKGGAIFNEEKLRWVNREYIKKLPKEETVKAITDWLPYKDTVMLGKITPLIIERISVWDDIRVMNEAGEFGFFFEAPEYDPVKLNWKDTPKEKTEHYLEDLSTRLEKISKDFTADTVKSAIWDYAEKEGKGNVLWPMRYALSGRDKSPDPFTLADILNKDETLKRLATAIEKLKKN